MAQQKKDKERFSAFLDELGKRLNKFRKSVLKTLGRATVLATKHGLAQRHELAGFFIPYPPITYMARVWETPYGLQQKSNQSAVRWEASVWKILKQSG